MNKAAVRKECFRRARAIPSVDKTAFSAAICRSISGTDLFEKAETIFSYLSLASEPDLRSLILDHPEKRWGLPRVSQADSMHFHEVADLDHLRESEFGFSEPDPERCSIIEAPDLILIPGVGFDPVTCARLGRGKGHYDRSLEKLLKQKPDLPRLGVCFAAQLTSLNTESHDVPMTHLVTENGLIG